MLVGISGKLGSGKDTLAKMIMEYFVRRDYPHVNPNDLAIEGYMNLSGIEIKKYADKLKDILCVLTGCTRAQLEDSVFKTTFLPPEWNRWIVERNDGVFPKGTKASKWYVTQDEAEACKMDLIRLNRGVDDYIVVEHQITYRVALQEIGTGLFREKFHPSTWINATFSDWKPKPGYDRGEHWHGHAITMGSTTEPKLPNWIITDVRFPDEVDAIKKRGGIVIRLNREELRVPKVPTNQEETDALVRMLNHPSETALDKFDRFDEIIGNDGTLEDLRKLTVETVQKFNLK